MEKIIFNKLPELPYAMEEAINRLRVNVNFLGNDVKTIMVVSCVPNEGKSLVSFYLWNQMAKSGIPSAWIDLDLRKSVVINKYQMASESGNKLKGTSQYLSSEALLEDSLYDTVYEGSSILPNVENIINPSILLENKRFDDMIEQLSKKYRYVFLDVPPIELVSDAEKIGSKCDGAILVVRAGDTSKRVVHSSIERLDRAGCPILGIVLNRAETKTGSYYYYKDKSAKATN